MITYSFRKEAVCIIPHCKVSSTPNLFLIFMKPVSIIDTMTVETW